MLRASAQTAGHRLNLKAVGNTDQDPELPAGRQLLDFTNALIGDPASIDASRRSLLDVAGPDGTARAALVAGNFEMMNRILDATGVPVPIRMGDITTELGLPPFTGRQ